jgi:hypothetical protein
LNINGDMNPEKMNSHEQFDVEQLTEDSLSPTKEGGSNRFPHQADHLLQRQLTHPFESVSTDGTPQQCHDQLNLRNQQGLINDEIGKDATSNISDLRAAYEQAKRGWLQDTSSASSLAASSNTTSSRRFDPREQHPDETQLSFPHVVSILQCYFVMLNCCVPRGSEM